MSAHGEAVFLVLGLAQSGPTSAAVAVAAASAHPAMAVDQGCSEQERMNLRHVLESLLAQEGLILVGLVQQIEPAGSARLVHLHPSVAKGCSLAH